MLIYPNPIIESTTVIIPTANNIINIKCIDVLGREEKINSKITRETDKTIITIERNNLPVGIYILNIKTNTNTYAEKLIITN